MLDMPLMNNNITREDVNALIEFLQQSDIFTQNRKVREFEEMWSNWLGVKHALFVNSGSSANYITMHVSAELYGKGEVIVGPLGWTSTVASVISAGHTPVFADVNMENLSANDEAILAKITPKTKAVFLTHVLGFDGLTDRLLSELKARKIFLFEDCCESHGATHKGRKIGTFGKASNYSFYYAHHMSTIEGGAVCTDDEEFYQYARMFRSHGMLRECSEEYREKLAVPDTYPEFTFPVAGFNMRSTEINAVIGLNQLPRLDANNEKRKANFALYLDILDSEKYFTDFNVEGSVNYAFILIVKNADEERYERVCRMLREENVEFRRGTAGGGNIARQQFIRKAFPETNPADLPNAEYIHRFGIYLGNYPGLEQERIKILCSKLNAL